MNEEILINVTPQETRLAVVQDGCVQELHIERAPALGTANEQGLVGNLYLGKVVRIVPGIQAAFFDIGLTRTAFLQATDFYPSPLSQPASTRQGSVQPPHLIEKSLFVGQTLLVQVIKDPLGTKGARLSTRLSLAGRHLVYLPRETTIGISQKITDPAQRTTLHARIKAMVAAHDAGGYLLRTNAALATDDELADDIQYLRQLWKSISEQAQRLPAPALLYQDINLAQRILRDVVSHHTSLVSVDCVKTFEQLNQFADIFAPTLKAKLHQYTQAEPLFKHYAIEADLQRALDKRIDLKSGGYLIIEHTEAMSVIDVNTGNCTGERTNSQTIFTTNLEAARTLAQQIRLRNLGGIIVVDFIDMASLSHRNAVLATLKEALAKDRVPFSVSSFSALGLVEITRKRTRASLDALLCEACPSCHGTGQIKTKQTTCYEILRDILDTARQFNPHALRVFAAAVITDFLLTEESAHLAQMQDLIGKPISLQSVAQFHQEQYEVVPLDQEH